MEVNYAIDYQTPREVNGLTRNDVITLLEEKEIYISIDSLAGYERGLRHPSPDLVVEFSNMYNEPFLTQRYCKYNCAIGKAYSYEILDNIDLNNLSNITLKLFEEHRESNDILTNILTLIVNKNTKEDFTEIEILKLKKCVHELLDTEHTIEILKIALNRILDMKEEIREHNNKCIERGYVNKKSPLAGTKGL